MQKNTTSHIGKIMSSVGKPLKNKLCHAERSAAQLPLRLRSHPARSAQGDTGSTQTKHVTSIFQGFLALALTLGLSLVPSTALAQAALPLPNCASLPGCGSAARNVIADAGIPAVALLLLNLTAALSVLFVIIGGGRFLLAFAREEEYAKAKKTILWALGGIIVALTSHQLVTAIITEVYIPSSPIFVTAGPVLGFLQNAVRILLTLLNVTFLLVIVIGGMRMVYARGKEEEVTKGRDMVVYAVVGVVIINLAPIVVKAVLRI